MRMSATRTVALGGLAVLAACGTEDPGHSSAGPLPEPPTAPRPLPEERYPASDCPEPPGGWEVPDPSRAGPDDQERVVSAINTIDGYAGAWLGWLIPESERTRQAIADPKNYVLNVLTTGDPAAMEVEVREHWGGKLCVTTSEHTSADLDRIADEVGQVPGVVSVGSETRKRKVSVGAWVATESLWRQLAEEHGAAIIDLRGILQPID